MKLIHSASLVCGNLLNLESDIIQINSSTYIDYLHFDVMDGNMVPRLGLMPEMFPAAFTHSSKPIDVHFMCKNVHKYAPLVKGAELVWIHVAEYTQILKYQFNKMGTQVGIVLNPNDSLDVLSIYDYDAVMLMAMNPGNLTSEMDENIFKRIEKTRDIIFDDMILAIDGKVGPKTYHKFVELGVNFLVLGTSSIYPNNKLDLSIRL